MSPKNLKTVRTIKINNGTLVAKIDSDDKIHWFRNNEEMTPNQIKTYKYYDPKIKNYRRLGNINGRVNRILYLVKDSVVSPIYTPSIDKITDIYRANRKNKMDLNKKQAVPFNGEYITLKTKGNMNLADIPINLLDSIAINSGRSNTNFWKNSALVGKESTFGGISRALGKTDSSSLSKDPKELVNNHIYFRDGYRDYLGALERKYNYEHAFNDNEKIKAEEDAKNALKRNQFINRSPKYSKYVFADAFKRYQLNPEEYNPGLGNYISMVNNIELELRNEKQLLNYWNTRGLEFYRRGLKEGINAMKKGGMLRYAAKNYTKDIGIDNNMNLMFRRIVDWDKAADWFNKYSLKKGSKMNILEFLKKGSGIHIKKKNRGKFTEYCGGTVTDECILKGKNSSSPTIRKRATFADNARHFKHRLGGSIVEAFKLRRLILSSLNNTANARKWKHKDGGVLKGQLGLATRIIGNNLKRMIRERLYNNVAPVGYDKPVERFINAVVFNSPTKKRHRSNAKRPTHEGSRDPIFAEYLLIDPKKRKSKGGYKLNKSKYSPSIGNENNIYYVAPLANEGEELGRKLLVDRVKGLEDDKMKYKPLKIGESKNSSVLGLDLGKHTISRGYDNKGEYVSYYDKWDIAPIGKLSGKLGVDQSLGIGKPLHFYDRIYLDDYYQSPVQTHSTYLPEITVKPSDSKKDKDNKTKWVGNKLVHLLSGGIIKADEGTKLTTELKIRNFFNSDWGSFLTSAASNILSASKKNNYLSEQGNIFKSLNEETYNDLMLQLLSQYLLDLKNKYNKWIQDYQAGLTNDNPSLIVALYLAYRQTTPSISNLEKLFKLKNKAIDLLLASLKADTWINTIGSIAQSGIGLLANKKLATSA